MKQEYNKPSLEVLGELRDVTAASSGGPSADLLIGITTIKPPGGSEGSN